MTNVRSGQQLGVTMGDLIRSMALAVAESQFELDKSAMMVAELMGGQRLLRDLDTGQLVDTSGEPATQPTVVDSRVYFGYDIVDGERVPRKLSMLELGFTPTFYQFVDTVIEVKVAMRVSGAGPSDRPPGAWHDGRSGATSLLATPVDAGYASSYNYDLEAAATFSTKLVPIPPPATLQERIEQLLAEEAAAPIDEDEIEVEEERRPVELPRTGRAFGGVGDYLTTATVAADRFARGFTVEAWVRDLDPDRRSAYVAGVTSDRVTAWRLGSDTGSFTFDLLGSGDPLQSQSTFDHSQWHHVVGSYADGDMRIYVDGRLQNVRTVESPPAPASVDLWLGAFPDEGHMRHLLGAIDEVRLWAGARDTSDLRADAEYRLGGGEPDLLGCWELLEGVALIGDQTRAGRTAAAHFDPGGMTFDGTSSWVRLDLTGSGLLDSSTLAYTIEVWMEPAAGRRLTPKGVVGLVGKQDGLDKDSYGGAWLEPDGYVTHQYRSGSDKQNSAGEVTGGPVESGEWSHVAISRRAGPGPAAVRLYVNGEEAASGEAWVPADAADHLESLIVNVGRNLDGQPKQYFGGRLAQLRVWNVARSGEEIAQFHRRRVDLASPGLVGLWPLRDPAGSHVADIGPYELHGERGGAGSTP